MGSVARKGGKQVELPCHHSLEAYLDDFIEAAGLQDMPRAPLFQTIRRGTDHFSGNPLPQANAYAMIQRRAVAAGISTAVCNHTFRATGITAYLKTVERWKRQPILLITHLHGLRSSMIAEVMM